jgi:hypothetical protein
MSCFNTIRGYILKPHKFNNKIIAYILGTQELYIIPEKIISKSMGTGNKKDTTPSIIIFIKLRSK